MKTKSVLFIAVAIAVILASCDGNGDYSNQDYSDSAYTLYVSRSSRDGGNVFVNTSATPNPPASTRNAGAAITLRAEPASGYIFENWTAPSGSLPAFTEGSATTATVKFNISSNVSIRANFQRTGYTLNVYRNTPDGGSVIVNNVNTNPSGTLNFSAVTTITLRAEPASNRYTFQNWEATTGALPTFTQGSATTPTITFSINSDVSIRANFQRTDSTLNVYRNIPAGGNVIVNNTNTNPSETMNFDVGAAITLRAETANGYTFVNWTAMTGALPAFTQGSAATATVTFNINSDLSIRANFRVNFQPNTLPVLMINTGGRSITSRDVWMTDVSYELFDDAGALLTQGETEIRGRGHSTWSRDDFPKKPYNLRLGSDKALLGMSAHNRWALLANYSDKTLIRTEVAFYKLASIFDNIPWTPSARQVDLYLNGEYRGVYLLTESVRASDNRVKFNRIRNTNPDGGFLIEVCVRHEDEYWFRSTRDVYFNCSSPDSNLDVLIDGTNITLFQKIRSYLQEAENVLYSSSFTNPSTGWQKYLEMDSFVDFYLINEVARNNDAQFYSSVYMYYDDAIGKLRMGPIWDFDISMGNIDYNGCFRTDGLYIYYAKWLVRLFDDPVFVAAVKARWIEKYDQLSTINQFIDERAAYLNTAQAANFQKWPTLNQYVWPNRVVTGSYAGEIGELKSWLSQRINWLNGALRNL